MAENPLQIRMEFSAKHGFPLQLFFLLVIGFIAYKRKRKASIKYTTSKRKFKSWIFFSSLSLFRNFFLLPKGKFSSFKDLTHKVLCSYLWCGLLLEVFCFRHYWFTTTKCEGQANKKEDKVSGNQSKLLELSLNFWKQFMAWSD